MIESTCVASLCGDDDGCGGKCTGCPENSTCDTTTWICDCPGSWCDSTCCNHGQACFPDDKCCTPGCTGKECGDDGCGGNCGDCKTYANSFCNTSNLCDCVPDCIGKDCGDDGCGGNCGECLCGYSCTQGTCLEEDPCAGKECGSDGCGGSCGTCNCGETCQSGSCIFTNCAGKECGSDGCGGSCGTCNCGSSCNQGTCLEEDPCVGKECGDDGCGGSCGVCSCGACQSGVCVSGTSSPTWIDLSTCLEWQNPPDKSTKVLEVAKQHCADLSLNGNGWRLPSISELRTLIRGCPATQSGGSCNIKEGDCLAESCLDDSCSGCSTDFGPANGCYWPSELQGSCDLFWSSTVVDGDGGTWGVWFTSGSVAPFVLISVSGPAPVRCVR